MERQRQLEWEKQRRQELISQRQKEQEAVCHLKNLNKNLTFELEQLVSKIFPLNLQFKNFKYLSTHTYVINYVKNEIRSRMHF